MRLGYLSDCVFKNAPQCEIFIVQDGPAAVQIQKLRDRINQAWLPVGSTILKVADADLGELLGDDQFMAIIAALGVGIDLTIFRSPDSGADDALDASAASPKVEFSIAHLRYHRIMIVTDQSPDGVQIRHQVVAILMNSMNPLVKNGFVYTIDLTDSAKADEDEFETQVLLSE